MEADIVPPVTRLNIFRVVLIVLLLIALLMLISLTAYLPAIQGARPV